MKRLRLSAGDRKYLEEPVTQQERRILAVIDSQTAEIRVLRKELRGQVVCSKREQANCVQCKRILKVLRTAGTKRGGK